jgi:hypothetical protein
MGVMAVVDKAPYIEIKRARIARSGDQVYTAQEIRDRGITPKLSKAFYIEHRPVEVIVKNLDKYNYIPLVSEPITYHTTEDVTPDNWKKYAVGMVGGKAALEYCDDGNVYVTNDIVFYDKDAYEAYQNGRRELSAGYDVASVAVDNPEALGYDLMVVDIPSINHEALCPKGRAGPNARILDTSVKDNPIDQIIGRKDTMNILKGIFGKSKDTEFVLSKAVLDNVAKVHTLKDEELKAAVADAMQYITPLGAGVSKDALVSAVSDSFKNPVEAIAKRDEVAKVIDGLYAKCLEDDDKAAKAVLDSVLAAKPAAPIAPGTPAVPAAPAAPAAPAKDTAQIVEEAVAKALAGVTDSLAKNVAAMVDESVNKALGINKDTKAVQAASSANDAADAALDDFDVSDLMAGVFGTR